MLTLFRDLSCRVRGDESINTGANLWSGPGRLIKHQRLRRFFNLVMLLLSGEIWISLPLHFCVVAKWRSDKEKSGSTRAFPPHACTHTHTKSQPFIKLLSSEEQRNRLAHVGCKQMYLQKTQLGYKFVVWSVKTFAVNTKLNLFCESTVGASNWMLFWCGYCQFYWAFIYFYLPSLHLKTRYHVVLRPPTGSLEVPG